jgi:hypothetical protein
MEKGEGMSQKYIFPTILIVLDVLASIVYLTQGDVRKTIYWFSAATLTAAVTY